MTSFGVRLAGETLGAAMGPLFIAANMGLSGYLYAKFSDLPTKQVALAWTVWSVAENTLMSMVDTFIENHLAQRIMKAFILAISTSIGIDELQKRALIGGRMVIVLIAIRIMCMIAILIAPFVLKSESK